jgi:DNA invertase Pin-like site-specific DNA recombinase
VRTRDFIRSRSTRSLAGKDASAAVGYTSVPRHVELTGEEASAQRQLIERTCADMDLRLVDVICEHEPDGPAGRPGLAYVLEQIAAGEASCLVVSDLERFSRHVSELAPLIDRLEREHVRLIAIDVGLDTATPVGRLAVAPTDGAGPQTLVPERPAEPEPVPGPEPAAPDAGEAAPADRPATRTASRALGYASTSADGGQDLDEQRQAIQRICERVGCELIEVVREREPMRGKALDRAGLTYLIDRVAAGEADCVVVAGLERISHSVAELGMIVQWLERNGVRLVAVEQQLDTASPTGKMTARTLASVAGWERERLSERTSRGLAAARAKRHAAADQGDTDFNAIKRRIAKMRADGMTLQAIADVLNAEGVPTQRGASQWRTSSVQTAAGYKRRTRSTKLDDLPAVEPRKGDGPDSGHS